MVWKAYDKLSDCIAGETVTISAILNTTSEFLKFLNNREIHLGLKINIKSVEAFDKSIVVSYSKRQNETLSHVVCERLLIEKKK